MDTGSRIKDILPRKRPRAVQVVAVLGLVYAAFGFYNQTYLHWIAGPWFSTYSERIVIVVFGIARVATEPDRYTRRRIAFLTAAVATLWLALPLFFGVTFFNHHVFGSVWFFLYLLAVFLVGRRADCSWNCPCAGIRETVGEPFRDRAPKGKVAWGLRWLKWAALASAAPYLWLVMVTPGAAWGIRYTRLFWEVHLNLYFASLLLVPLTGNRNYCRYLCPWGALYGLIGRLGFFRIVAERQRCVPCTICERACDMGVPLRRMIEARGEIRTADCIGCGRCVLACPRGALSLQDFRDWLPLPRLAHSGVDARRTDRALKAGPPPRP